MSLIELGPLHMLPVPANCCTEGVGLRRTGLRTVPLIATDWVIAACSLLPMVVLELVKVAPRLTSRRSPR